MTELSQSEDGILIKWKPVDGVDGYIVYRKVLGGTWYRLSDDCDSVEYFDQYVRDDLTYEYIVKSYVIDELTGEYKYGPANNTPLLCVREPVMFAPVLAQNEKGVLISFENLSGVTNVSVLRSEDGTDWTVLAGKIALAKGSYVDEDITIGKKYYYKLTAKIEYCSDVFESPSETIQINDTEFTEAA